MTAEVAAEFLADRALDFGRIDPLAGRKRQSGGARLAALRLGAYEDDAHLPLGREPEGGEGIDLVGVNGVLLALTPQERVEGAERRAGDFLGECLPPVRREERLEAGRPGADRQ